MGINIKSLTKFKNTLSNNFKDTEDLKLLELGIQEANESLGFKYLRDNYDNKFKNYVSVDLHDLPNVTKVDLSEIHHNLFSVDIITNFGTSEHVEYQEGQYNCWKNIHNWLKVGGIMIHEIPEYGSWTNHCRYFTDYNFFKNLENYGYSLLEFDNHVDENGNLNWAVLKKIHEKDFMSIDVFYMYMKQTNLNMNRIHPINNPKNLK